MIADQDKKSMQQDEKKKQQLSDVIANAVFTAYSQGWLKNSENYKLNQRFGNKDLPYTIRRQLQDVRQNGDEMIEEFAERVQEMATYGVPIHNQRVPLGYKKSDVRRVQFEKYDQDDSDDDSRDCNTKNKIIGDQDHHPSPSRSPARTVTFVTKRDTTVISVKIRITVNLQ
ncbi:unnamed protein product [Mytilus edulis]|uniref:Uncharacterized protein n=1 Tax=Mytilus edulis TaxID=6550 RepID=A0A8S3SGQ1_MYTED|nr:unnamed protein product [Mytilus edulis]